MDNPSEFFILCLLSFPANDYKRIENTLFHMIHSTSVVLRYYIMKVVSISITMFKIVSENLLRWLLCK